MAVSPREYISWSQYTLFCQSAEKYKDVYIYGKERSNKYTRLGKWVAEEMEKKESKDPMIRHIKNFIPILPKQEYEIEVNFGGVPLKGYLDQFNPRSKALREMKTGKKWSQSQVDKHKQLDFYALLVYAKFGTMPKSFHLDWLETKETEMGLILTGEVKSFQTQRKLSDIMRIHTDIKRVWKEIQEITEEEYAKI